MASRTSAPVDRSGQLPSILGPLFLTQAALLSNAPPASVPSILLCPQAALIINAADTARRERRNIRKTAAPKQTPAPVSRASTYHPSLQMPTHPRPRLVDYGALKRSLVSPKRLANGARQWKTRATNDEDFVRRLWINEPCLMPCLALHGPGTMRKTVKGKGFHDRLKETERKA